MQSKQQGMPECSSASAPVAAAAKQAVHRARLRGCVKREAVRKKRTVKTEDTPMMKKLRMKQGSQPCPASHLSEGAHAVMRAGAEDATRRPTVQSARSAGIAGRHTAAPRLRGPGRAAGLTGAAGTRPRRAPRACESAR